MTCWSCTDTRRTSNAPASGDPVFQCFYQNRVEPSEWCEAPSSNGQRSPAESPGECSPTHAHPSYAESSARVRSEVEGIVRAGVRCTTYVAVLIGQTRATVLFN